MSIKYFFFFLLVSSISFANDKSFYDGRSKFIQEYIDELTKYQKEDSNYRGAVVESLSGSFFAAFNTKSQSDVDKQALDICDRKKGAKCKVRFQSLRINSSYNRLAQYDSNKKILDVGMHEIPSALLNTYKGITYVRSVSNFKEKDFSCDKNTLNYNFVIDMINSQIDLFPQSFLRKAGLNYVMICDDILVNASHPEGLAPSHYDQSPGVFFLSLKKIKKQIDSGQSNIIKHIFHHEFYHIIDSTLTKAVVDEEWVKLNRYPYSNKNLKANFKKILTDQKGFVSSYAKNDEFEDKAEVFAYLMTRHQKMKKILTQDRILYNKTKLLIQRMKSLSSEINKNFWSKL